MSQGTTAGRLLRDLATHSAVLRDMVIAASAISPERAACAESESLRLTLSEQLRLAEATRILAPDFARPALRLRGQAVAAQTYVEGDVELHSTAPAERWERAAHLRG